MFISHDTKDYQLARKIASSLERIGIEPFLAKDQLLVGARLSDKITAAIDDSNCFVPILTKNSVGSQWVNQEIAYAYARSRNDEIGIFPVVERGLSITGLIDQSTEFVALDLDDVEEAIYELVLSLRTYINRNWPTL